MKTKFKAGDTIRAYGSSITGSYCANDCGLAPITGKFLEYRGGAVWIGYAGGEAGFLRQQCRRLKKKTRRVVVLNIRPSGEIRGAAWRGEPCHLGAFYSDNTDVEFIEVVQK